MISHILDSCYVRPHHNKSFRYIPTQIKLKKCYHTKKLNAEIIHVVGTILAAVAEAVIDEIGAYLTIIQRKVLP